MLTLKIAVITGASSGLGREYAFAAARRYADIDELWLIARREENLRQTAEQISKRVRIIPLDITKEESVKTYISMLEEEKPEIALLINNAGFGKLGDFDKLSYEDNGGMVRLNCEALTVMTSVSLPYIRMSVYCSTKAYVLSLSKALRSELRLRGINVLAVCPGPMDTEFLPLAGIAPGSSHTFDTLPRVNPTVMAEKSLAASARKKGVYTNLLFYKFYRVLAKLLPHSLVMKMCGA